MQRERHHVHALVGFGARRGLADLMTEPWWIWLTEMSTARFDMVTLENSPRMPLSMFKQAMQGRAEAAHIVFGPEACRIHEIDQMIFIGKQTLACLWLLHLRTPPP